MNLYLMQHGQATDEDENPERPLTLQGRADVETVAAHVARHGAVGEVGIFHSGKLRAEQTADILAEHLKATAEQADGLKPMDDPQIWVDRLNELHRDTVLAGHLPHLSRLLSLLVAGDPERPLAAFRNGGMVALQRDSKGAWSIRWIVTPDIVS